MKRGSDQHDEKSMDQECERESFNERGGCLQLQIKRFATVLRPLRARTGLKAPDRWAISHENSLQRPILSLLDQRQSCSYPRFLLGNAALQGQNLRSDRLNHLPGALNGVDNTLHALQDRSGRFGLSRRLECCLPGLA